MVSTASLRNIVHAAERTERNRNSKSGSSNQVTEGSNSSSLVLALAASACLLGGAAVYFCYYNHVRKQDHSNGNRSKNNTTKLFGIDNVGDWGRRNKGNKTGKSHTNSDGGDSDDETSPSFDLPQHLQRELYKIERRKASVRFLAMKKPLYDNIEMFGPDGTTMLCTIGTKKANWYVRKELAVWRDIPGCHPSIRLLFEPKNSKNCKINRKKQKAAKNAQNKEEPSNDEQLRKYNCTHKLNICVSCGARDASESKTTDNDKESRGESGNGESSASTAGLMRHYVVPYAYRKLLPAKFKTHLPHDVVLLCLDCHVDAEQAAKTMRTNLYEKLYRKDPSTRPAIIVDQTRKRLKSYARALWKHKAKLPPERVEQYKSTIKEYLASKDNVAPTTIESTTGGEDIPEDVLRDLALNLEPEQRNPRYIPLADLVVENLCHNDQAVSEFVVGWREFFVDTLHPKHLPAGWSVHSPVEIDEHPEEDSENENENDTTTEAETKVELE